MNQPELYQKQSILGVGYNFIDYKDLKEAVLRWRDARENHYITFAPTYSIALCKRNSRMAEATRKARFTLPDGIGNIFAARILGYRHKGRVTAPLTMLKLCDWGRQDGLRHYFYGGASNVPDKLTGNLRQMYPGIEIAGAYSPPFRPLTESEDAEVVDMINAAEPDIVWVGLGAPKQEIWMLEHLGRVKAAAMLGVGVTFNYHAGTVKWAPPWIRNAGLEWVYRMVQEPVHYSRRVVHYPGFALAVVRQKFSSALKSSYVEDSQL